MKIKNIAVVSILGLVLLIGFLRINHLNFLQQLRNDSEKFKMDYIYFRNRYYTGYPKEKKDIEFMLEWMKENKSEVHYTFLDHGYNINYRRSSGTAYLYSFGQNSKDNTMQSTPFNLSTYYDSFLNCVPISNGSFKDYISSWFYGYDVILIDFQYRDLQCASGNASFTYENLFSDLRLYKGVKNLSETVLEQDFKDGIVDFCITELKTDIFNVDEKVLVFINEKGDIVIKCPVDLPMGWNNLIKEKLSNYLKVNNIDFFDHALFSIYITTTDNMLFQNLGTNDL